MSILTESRDVAFNESRMTKKKRKREICVETETEQKCREKTDMYLDVMKHRELKA